MPVPMPTFAWMVRLKMSGPGGSGGRPAALSSSGLHVVAAALVVDRGLDLRFGEDPREHERQ